MTEREVIEAAGFVRQRKWYSGLQKSSLHDITTHEISFFYISIDD